MKEPEIMSNTRTDWAENLKRLGCLVAVLCFAAVVAGFLVPLHSSKDSHVEANAERTPGEKFLRECNSCFEAKNFESAVQYYSLAAEWGNAEAQYNLGCCYEKGDGVEKDLKETVEWFRKTAEQGSEKAKAALERLGAE